VYASSCNLVILTQLINSSYSAIDFFVKVMKLAVFGKSLNVCDEVMLDVKSPGIKILQQSFKSW